MPAAKKPAAATAKKAAAKKSPAATAKKTAKQSRAEEAGPGAGEVGAVDTMPPAVAEAAAPAAAEPAADEVDQEPAESAGPTFESFNLSAPVRRALTELGFEGPTPIQRDSIPPLLEGRDVMAQAQTGTGKTAAFGIPVVERVDPAHRRTQALILAPTRELAVQVAEHLHELGRHRGVSVLPVYGGQPYERQLRGLRDGAHVVVGTPGRVTDHLRRGALRLEHVGIAVLDEADEMLNMGFLEDVGAILDSLQEARRPEAEVPEDVETGEAPAADPDAAAAGPAKRKRTTRKPEPEAPQARAEGDDSNRAQIALFSATLPPPVRQLAQRYMRAPVRIDVSPGQISVPQIEQVAYEVSGMDKLDALSRVLDVETPGSAIVFCATRRAVDEVADRLAVRGYRVAPLHGDMAQGERERVLRRFRDGQIEVLVATDVAARGLDVESVTHVVNFDIPWDPESYVHRIGRTGRAGRAGDAITLVTPRDYRHLQTIERLVKARITRKRLPSLADVATRRRESAKQSVVAALEEIQKGDLDAYLTLAGELGDAHDPIEVAAAALRLWDVARNAAGGADGATLSGIAEAAAEEEVQAERRRQEHEASRMRREESRRAASEFEADGLAPEAGMTRLFVALGRRDGLRPQDLVGAIANEAGLRGKDVGAIDIYDQFAFVEVPSDAAQRVVQQLGSSRIRNQPSGIRFANAEERAAPRQERPRGDRPPGRFGRPAWGDREDRGDRGNRGGWGGPRGDRREGGAWVSRAYDRAPSRGGPGAGYGSEGDGGPERDDRPRRPRAFRPLRTRIRR